MLSALDSPPPLGEAFPASCKDLTPLPVPCAYPTCLPDSVPLWGLHSVRRFLSSVSFAFFLDSHLPAMIAPQLPSSRCLEEP